MALSKLKFLQDKKTALVKQQRRQMADLLGQGKETSAKIRVENIIRDDIYIELLEYLELYCELLLARITMLVDPARTTVDKSLSESVASLVYSAPHTELKELVQIRDVLVHKYGFEYGRLVLDNYETLVPRKIWSRCVVDPPSEELVDLYLSEIARTYQVPYSGLKVEVTADDDNDDYQSDGGEGGGSKVLNPPLSTEGSGPEASTKSTKVISQAKKEQNEVDNLRARFAALKGP